MEKAEYVNIPKRQMRARQQIQDDDEAIETTVKMFSLENAADRVFHRKKKVAGEFDEDEVDEDGRKQNDNRNQLAVLSSDFDDDADAELTGEEMEDWLKKLHIRTQHLVGKVTVTGMSRLAATNHVATALTRFKGKYRIDTDKVESNEDNSFIGTEQLLLPVTGTTPIQTPKVVEGDPSKEEAVGSKKVAKRSTEHRVQKRKESSSGSKVVVVSSHIRKAVKTSIPAGTAVSTDGIRKTTKAKITKSVRSAPPSKSKIH